MFANLRTLPLVVLCAVACVGPADRIIVVKGELVDEVGTNLADCTLSLTEMRQATDRFTFKTSVSDKFDVAITYWAPSYSSYEIAIDCPEGVTPYRSGPVRVSGSRGDPIDLGRIMILRRRK
jgi:hypothetical protein